MFLNVECWWLLPFVMFNYQCSPIFLLLVNRQSTGREEQFTMRGKLTLLDEINICSLYIQLNENTNKYTTRLSWSINAPWVLCRYEAEKRPLLFYLNDEGD